MRKFLYYFGWTVVIGFIIYLGAKYQVHLQREMSQTMDPTNYLRFSVVLPILIGFLLGVPKLINKIQQQKEWTFDWIKFLTIGLPTLLILFFYLYLHLIPEGILPLIPEPILLRNQTIQVVASIILGYVILDSFQLKSNSSHD